MGQPIRNLSNHSLDSRTGQTVLRSYTLVKKDGEG
jgi:hypothetical protein